MARITSHRGNGRAGITPSLLYSFVNEFHWSSLLSPSSPCRESFPRCTIENYSRCGVPVSRDNHLLWSFEGKWRFARRLFFISSFVSSFSFSPLPPPCQLFVVWSRGSERSREIGKNYFYFIIVVVEDKIFAKIGNKEMWKGLRVKGGWRNCERMDVFIFVGIFYRWKIFSKREFVRFEFDLNRIYGSFLQLWGSSKIRTLEYSLDAMNKILWRIFSLRI